MIKNYFKIAWRNGVRSKTFSAINISGLALGITCSLLIMLWIQDERSVDGFHANGKLLYQVYERQTYDGKVTADYTTQGLLADELKRVIPEVQYASAMEMTIDRTFEAGNKTDKMNGTFAGADFFNMFSYPLLQGTPQTALNAPEVVAISRKMAEHFFGSPEKAVGKTIRYENKEDLLVSAVFENIPTNASHQFDYLRSWKDYVKQQAWVQNWSSTSPATYVQLRPNADPARVSAKIRDFIYRYSTPQKGFKVELDLQPYPEKYLHSTFKDGWVSGGRIEYVRLFTVVCIFILLIACINFMNLATARSTKRAKEVGIRKAVGAMRTALVGQFIGEALLLTFISLVIAVMATGLLLPLFNNLTGKQLLLPFGQPVFWAALLGLLLLTSIVAGSYPALFLSSLKPVRVLKGRLQSGKGAVFFRKGLVVFQFTLSVILIIGTIVVYRQMDYVQNKNLGYDRENLLYIPLEGDLVKRYDLFKAEAAQLPGVVSVSKIKHSPTAIAHHTGDIFWTGKDPNLRVSFTDVVVGYDFVKTMRLQLREGRDFSRAYATDSTAFILNETAVKRIGYENPIGQAITWGNHPGRIIGVLKDFHFNSMHQAIEPLIIRVDENWPWGTVLVRTQAGKTRTALAGLEKLSKTINPKFPFTCQFSDQQYAKLYKSEQIVSKLSNLFALLAILISCLGLFGLAAFSAEQRIKEIGVRKALGASIPDIVKLLSVNFLKPVMLAILIAFPVAWYAMDRWLTGFAYKIGMEWWMFALAGLMAIGIALLTVSFQSIRAALTDPVKSLRAE